MKCNIVFNILDCVLQRPSMRTLPLGKLQHDLYYFEDISSIHNSPSSTYPPSIATDVKHTKNDYVKTKLWHRRLGHMSVDNMHYVKEIFDREKCSLDSICQICPIEKQNRVNFHNSSIKTTKTFKLIHIDT